MPTVRRFTDAAEFGRCVHPLLARNEAGNNLPFRILRALMAQPGPLPPQTYLAACLGEAGPDATVEGVGLRTPPHNLVLSSPCSAGAVAVLLADTAGMDLPGVIGPREEADAFAAGWRLQFGGTTAVTMGLGVYALEQVNAVLPVPGRLRPAVPGDAGWAQDWIRAFHAEAVPHGPPPEEPVDLRGHFFWEVDGRPVTSVCAQPATPNGAVINAVYTPPTLRRRGYATATVAAASALMLGAGCRLCFLFTDLANPTSNGIYQRIGYRRMGEFRQIGFTPPVTV
jgi:GNAT superfamily N-acetyltransferase